jgi:hypothetical protein
MAGADSSQLLLHATRKGAGGKEVTCPLIVSGTILLNPRHEKGGRRGQLAIVTIAKVTAVTAPETGPRSERCSRTGRAAAQAGTVRAARCRPAIADVADERSSYVTDRQFGHREPKWLIIPQQGVLPETEPNA